MQQIGNKLTILVTESTLQLGLWSDQTCLNTVQVKLNQDLIEQFFPAWTRLCQTSSFQWDRLERLYFLKGPGRFTVLRLITVVVKQLAVMQPNLQFYTLDTLLFQVATSNLTISLLTANKQHYYVGQFRDFQLQTPPRLLAKDQLANLTSQLGNPIVLIDFKQANLNQLWIQHYQRFKPIGDWRQFQAFLLNPFSLDKIS